MKEVFAIHGYVTAALLITTSVCADDVKNYARPNLLIEPAQLAGSLGNNQL